MKKIGFATLLMAALLIPTMVAVQIAPKAGSPIVMDGVGDIKEAYMTRDDATLSKKLLELPSYEVTFVITAPDDSPATHTHIWVFSGYPPERRFPEGFPKRTGESNTATFTLTPGNYTAVFQRPEHPPRFFALYKFYVSSDATLNLEVGSPDVPATPVTLQVINPLEDRPLSEGYFNLLLLDYMYQARRTPSYSSDSPGTTLIYLMPNYRYGFSYMDYVGKYLLFKPNVKVTATTTTVTIDASKVGFVKPAFELPIDAIFDDYDLSIFLKGSKAPFAWLGYEKEEDLSIAITPGTYEAWHCFEGYYEDAYYYFEIYNPKLKVKGKAATNVNWGGSFKAFLKCDKKSYKIGGTVKLTYWFEDGFKNKVTVAYYYNFTTEEGEDLLPTLNIYDPSDQFVQSIIPPELCKYKTHYYFWTSGVPPGEYSFDIGHFIAPGKYKLEIVLDTGPYQGEVSTYINITIKK